MMNRPHTTTNKRMIVVETFAAFAAATAEDFRIGAYCLKPYARMEQHIKDIRECHVDFVYGIEHTDRKTLDLLAKYGLKAIVEGVYQNWWGGNKGLNGKLVETIPPHVVEKGAAAMKAAGTDCRSETWFHIIEGDSFSARAGDCIA